MDDVNINNICLVEETEVVGDEQEWIKLSWISDQSDNNGDLQSSESTENMEKNMDDKVVQTKNYDKGSYTSVEPEDISDGISVITESDTDVINTNSSEVCQFYSKPYKSLQMVEAQRNKWNISYLELNTFVLGLILGLMLGYFFMIPETCPISNTISTKNLEIASHNIVNTCKGLKEVKSILNEIKAYIPLDKKITKQFLEITNSSNETNETKPIVIIKESFNFTVYPLDQLQESLYILSSLTIYDGNSSLKNEINKTLNIMNNVKEFYDKLKLMNNNTEDISNSIVLNFLQHDSENIRNISKSLLSNLIEKASKVTSKIYNKYNKERYKLNKKMCHLKNILADDKILKQLTENNQLFKDYNTSCFSNYMSENFDGKAAIKKNTKTNDIKKQTGKTDDSTMHTKYNKDIHKIYDNRHNSFKNKDKQNKFTFNMDRFLQNANNKIYNTSQFFLSKIAEKINILKYELNKKVHNLKDMLSDCNKFLEQLIEDNKEEKISIKHKGKSDYLQSTVLSENDISKDNFDILTQLKNMFPFSSNYCSQFNINMTTLDTASNYKTNYKHKKRDTTSKKAASNHANSAQILLAEEKNRPKEKDYSKSNGSTKKVFDDKTNNERKHVSSHIKMKNHVSKDTVNYQKSKHSSFDSRKTLKENDQLYMHTDRKSNVEKSHEDDKKQRQHGASDWYFQRVYSRRNARRRAKYQYITIGYRR